MKKSLYLRAIALSLSLLSWSGMLFAQMPPFTVAPAPWNADQFGNIRAVVNVEAAEKTAFARIEWRRRDIDPAEKAIIVTTSGGRRVATVSFGTINREYGEVYFEPLAGPGIYYIYYLPYTKSGITPRIFIRNPHREQVQILLLRALRSTKPGSSRSSRLTRSIRSIRWR